MIRIVHPSCEMAANFVHVDAAIAFLRVMAGQISAADFIAVVMATSGPQFEALARAFIAGCMGAPA